MLTKGNLHSGPNLAKWTIVHCFVCWMVMDIERLWLENWWEKHLGKKYVNRPWQMCKGCEDICVPCNAHRKVTSAKEFSNQDGMPYSVHTQLLSLSYSCHCPMSTWTKWPWRHRWGLWVGSTIWTFTNQDWPGYSCFWMPNQLTLRPR